MGHVRTSAIFYRRGIPNNNNTFFGVVVVGNYNIVNPTSVFINSINSKPTPIQNFSLYYNIRSLR